MSLKTNLFGNQICPSGGLRSHCPRGKNCLYKHRDDTHVDAGVASNFAANNIAKLGAKLGVQQNENCGNNGYKEKLRSSDKFTTSPPTTTTPSKSGLSGMVRKVKEIFTPPAKLRLNDSDDLFSDTIEIETVDNELDNELNDSNDSNVNTQSCSQEMNSSSFKWSAVSEKIHNLQGVYGDNNRFPATGLKNPARANICYLNSVIQSLANSRVIVKLLSPDNKKKYTYPCQTLREELGFMIRVLQSGEYKHVMPADLKDFIDHSFEKFRGNRQHDAHELLTCILAKIKDEFNLSGKERLAYEGEYESVVTCDTCSTTSEPKFEVFNSLQVPILHKGTLPSVEKGIRDICKDEGEVKWDCPSCKSLCQSTKKLKLKELPEMLVLQIKRFGEDEYGFFTKDNSEVMFSESLVIENENANHEYELYAFINHFGKTYGGHYTACCRGNISNSNTQWHHYDDSRVVRMNMEEVNKRNAYILFYRQKTMTKKPLPAVDSATISLPSPACVAPEIVPADPQSQTPPPLASDADFSHHYPITPVNEEPECGVDLVHTEAEIHKDDDYEKPTIPEGKEEKKNEELQEMRERRERKLSRKAREGQESQGQKLRKTSATVTNDDKITKNDTIGASNTNPSKKKQSEAENGNVSCVCRKADSGIMIDCDKCEGWFHTKCITFVCENCNFSLPKGSGKELQDQIDKLQKAKVKMEMESKNQEDEIASSKAVIKDLEKKLSAKNKSLESMTLSCQNNQASVRSLKDQNDELGRKITLLECTLEKKEEELKELKIENKAHKAAMDTVIDLSQGHGVGSAEENEENESLKNQLKSANQINEDLKASHKGSLNLKNNEIRNLKNTVKVLEEDLKNINSERDHLKEKLDTSKAEVDRAQNITDLLVEKHSRNANAEEEVSSQELTSQEENIRNTTKSKNSNPRVSGNGGRDKNVLHGEDKSNIPCLTLFKEGKCNNKRCSRLHDINMHKVNRGICVHEFSSHGSCPWKGRCMYTHDIPPEIYKEPKVVKEQKEKMNEVTGRRKSNLSVRKHDVVDCGVKEKESERNMSKKDFLKDPPAMFSSDGGSKKAQKFNQHKRPLNGGAQNDRKSSSEKRGDLLQHSKSQSDEMNNDDTLKTVNSFLQLIRPMLMDQVSMSVRSCMEKQKNEILDAMGNMMTNQLTLM